MFHSASFFGISTPTIRCSRRFEGGRPRRLVRCGLVLRAGRIDVGEPAPQLADEADDLLPGLVADPTHQVDVADGELQQVADGEDVGPFQGVAGTGAQAQGGDRRRQVGLLQRTR